MKRFVSLMACALLLVCLCPWTRAEEGAVSIGSREDMQQLVQDPSGSYELTDDIDMGGAAWTPVPFSGKLNGNGHTLYNLTVTEIGADTATTYDGNRIEYETVFGGLFSVMTDAEVQDLNLVNAVVAVQTDRHCFLGALAGYAAHSRITGCTVQARNHLTLTSVNAGVGGLVGFSLESEISDCTMDAELVFTDTNQEVLCEEFLGGVYACGCGKVARCTVRTRGFAEVYGYAHSGGLIGMFKGVKNSRYKSFVRDTTADTEISFFEITPSRRAYCSPTIGEDSKHECARSNMKTVHYEKNESKSPAPMTPEKCETPQYTDKVTNGTCESWGYTTHTCQTCGYTYRDGYTPPAHNYTVEKTVPATCTESGKIELKCTRCGHVGTEILPPLGHEYEEIVTPPTCTQDGERAHVCTRCGDRYGDVIPATGHVIGEWEVAQPPQINVAGEEQRLCQICGVVMDRRTIPALPYVPPVASTPSPTLVPTSPAPTPEPFAPVSYTPWQWVKHYILFGWLWE